MPTSMRVTMQQKTPLRVRSRLLFTGLCATLTMVVLGCDGGPPAPSDGGATGYSPSPSAPRLSGAFIWAMVLEDAGGCIPGATIQVLSGPVAGPTIVQVTPCDAWSYDGGVWIGNLMAGTVMTLRASADGYVSETKTAVAVSEGGAVEFVLKPVQSMP